MEDIKAQFGINGFGNSIHFYGKERNVFFDVLNAATSAIMKDISVKKLGLQDLMDAKYAKDGIH